MKPMSKRHKVVAWVWAVAFWFLTLLACNVPWQRQTIPPAPTFITPQGTPANAPPATVPANTLPILTVDVGTLPTFTPVATPLFPPTLSGPAPTATLPQEVATTTATPPLQGGNLSFTYTLAWALSAENPYISIATVTIMAQGGNAPYTYYHDDILQIGAVFTYEWASCRPNPGSLRVDSSDGQTVRLNYWETPPCPETPTP